MQKIFQWVQARFYNVWNSNYPKYFHLINLILSIVLSIIFLIKYNESISLKIALFIPIIILGYLIFFSFTYGVVRSRKAWTKKRK